MKNMYKKMNHSNEILFNLYFIPVLCYEIKSYEYEAERGSKLEWICYSHA